ncbi:hypothetical protein DAEQUDRAFT_732966 [Daedalea quercina L-15889]|uniref:Golgi apparatus membrane protein TVP38 n=1 Tax=Daedalea quercina L-15889 TaxID=1314783 RepID=A0A165LAU7_9APHY|nr:hypothetical protein DAEQUDRAFT_732966 [Daedalea quercina L-15889]
MASYPAYGTPRASPTPYTSAAPAAAGDGQFYPPGASRISLDDEPRAYKKTGAATVVDMRAVTRTPSPTPSEAEELTKTSVFDWKAMSHWRYWVRREWLWYYVIFFIAMIAAILFTVFHTQIVKWMQPGATKIHDLPAGWLIPIAILFVISFPPLFGHEIVAILCGLVWGLGVGFAIVCAGTFLGELGNFYAFKYCCSARGEKLEKTDLRYACMAKVVREGGVKVALITRMSAIPGHFSTAVFSTCGMSVWTFLISAFLSLPKQFITVYLGVALEQSDSGGGSTSSKALEDVVVGLTVVITFAAMWYIFRLMNRAKPEVIYERRKARQAKLMGLGSGPYANMQSTASVAAFNPSASDESQVPLTAHSETFGAAAYQQWDASGRAVGTAGDPRLYVPEPRRAVPIRPLAEAPTHRPQGARADSGASMGSAYQMSERGAYQSAPMRSDTALTNPYPHPYAQAQAQASASPVRPTFTASPPPMRPAYTASPPPIAPPVSAPAHANPPQSPPSTRPPQTAPVPQYSYGVQAVPSPPPMPNPFGAQAVSSPPLIPNAYAGYAPSPPPANPTNPFSPAYGSGSAPSTPPAHVQSQYTGGGYPYAAQAQVQMPGTAPLPPNYSSQAFGQQQGTPHQYPQTAMPPSYSSDLR